MIATKALASLRRLLAIGALGAATCAWGEEPASLEHVYPKRALNFCLEGWVILDYVVQADGRVKDVKILESQPQGVFDEAAVRTYRLWTFTPRTRNGVPVSERRQQRMEFELPAGC